jgi:hypothetical protein
MGARASVIGLVVAISVTGCSTATVTSVESPRVVLDHAFAVVDDQTYDAITNSDFLTAVFAASRVAKVASGAGEGWTGTYFFGPQTYIEILRAGSVPHMQPGMGGVGFVVERRGDLDHVEAIFRKRVRAPVSRAVMSLAGEGGAPLPNFYMLTLQFEGLGNVGLVGWFMEYHERMAEKYGGITRADIHSVSHDPTKALGNITAIKSALNEPTRAAYREVFASLNYSIKSEGDVTVLNGPEQTIHMGPESTGVWGIKEIGFSLATIPSKDIERAIGNTKLLLRRDGTGVWLFGVAARSSTKCSDGRSCFTQPSPNASVSLQLR